MAGGMATFSMATGLLLGFASSLHCAGMCGGIAASLCFAINPNAGAGSRSRLLLTSQMGRVTSYMGLGAIAGAFGTLVYGVLPPTSLHFALRAIAALSIGWIGFATLGLVPAGVTLDHLFAPVMQRVGRPMGNLSVRAASPFLCGLAWGLMPCAMVWGSLFYAMAAGSAAGGSLTMLAFGIGTIPAVTLTALGISHLRDIATAPSMRLGMGLALIAIAVLSLAVPSRIFATLCLRRPL